eukprot:scaffold108868_cov39-Prasinocladus_malaysianus.AAC.1
MWARTSQRALLWAHAGACGNIGQQRPGRGDQGPEAWGGGYPHHRLELHLHHRQDLRIHQPGACQDEPVCHRGGREEFHDGRGGLRDRGKTHQRIALFLVIARPEFALYLDSTGARQIATCPFVYKDLTTQ